MMTISKRGVALIKEHEGLRLKAYLCPANVWTIGYGHTGADVFQGKIITEHEAENLLIADLIKFERAVRNNVHKPLTQNQFDALVSFTFNLGEGSLKKSTLLRKVNQNPNDPSIELEFKKWVNAAGRRLPGLVKRRAQEVALYFKPSWL